jgi:hypothetical protein
MSRLNGEQSTHHSQASTANITTQIMLLMRLWATTAGSKQPLLELQHKQPTANRQHPLPLKQLLV